MDALRHRFDQFDALLHLDAFPDVLKLIPQVFSAGHFAGAIPQASLHLVPQVFDWIEVWGLSRP
jgi:hypothetical protein